ncbi:hypothetical protein E2C01_100742 [Portunus trituberculatus]|uniref:Uncharacterized protein n=1 Tax=Portunus trituberculatus TaxID=210409 RepID=A0A5B7K8U6_PORTR|nr:hypothetical protein [Portunus trituberculatus]
MTSTANTTIITDTLPSQQRMSRFLPVTSRTITTTPPPRMSRFLPVTTQ